MFEAVLFDLDGTLLDIDMDSFLPRYFEEMGRMAAQTGCCDPRQLVEQILRSTEVMIRDIDPASSNEATFMEHFFRSLEADEEQMRSFFEEFYRTGFPRLQKFSQPFAGVPEMVAKVISRGHKVVIATNAVFPSQAIQSRLEWAGIGEFSYALKTSYENMHFCKPHPQYYLEIAETIGVEPSRCLMVGNDSGEDLVAGTVGMKTYLVEDRMIDKGGTTYCPDWRGSLADLIVFMDEIAGAVGAG